MRLPKERTLLTTIMLPNLKLISWPEQFSRHHGHHRSKLFVSLFLFYCFINLIGKVSAAGDANANCVCKVGVPCERNVTSLDCPNGRVISRRDCTCCFVCAKQLGETCNDSEFPCDIAFGLICGEDSKCQVLKSCNDDSECSSDQQCTGGACAEVCKIRPNICKEDGIRNGICSVRNHRAFCSCPNGHILNSEQECVSAREDEDEATHCEFGGHKIEVGRTIYMQNCEKACECDEAGEIICEDLKEPPNCKEGFIPMSMISGEMNEACKILIGNDTVFDGCCVPETCRNVTSQDEISNNGIARGFKLSEAQNNLGDYEEEQQRPREMLIGTDDSQKKILQTNETSNKNSKKLSPPPSLPLLSSSAPTLTTDSEQVNMQILVSAITSHSALINLPKNDKEAMLSIALSSALKKAAKDDSTPQSHIWRDHRIPSILPFLTLSDLLSNTSYTVKYSVGEKAYPLVEFKTLPEGSEIAETMRQTSSEKPTSSSTIAAAAAAPAASEKTPTELNSGEDLPQTSSSSASQVIKHSAEGLDNDNSSESSSNSNLFTSTTESINTTVTSANSDSACVYNSTNYAIGAIVYEGCDQKCECMKNGQMKCADPCSIPFFKKGSFAHDKLCFEEPSGVDDCCVIVACARTSGEPRELSFNPCDSTNCGKNAECRSEVSPSGMHSEPNQSQETLCVCKEGYTGDPYDEVVGCEGVTPSSTSSTSSSNANPTIISLVKQDGCVYDNKTYEYGEEYLDGCTYKCHCESSGEFLCRPRCSYRSDEQGEIPKGCQLQKDSSDPECCEQLVCEGEALESKKNKSSNVPIDGCVYKNKTYQKDEKFYDGCEQQCMCFSNGDVTCQPRCPPAGPVEKDCITLPDPIDKCCTVTICGNTTINDVMKAGNESLQRTTTTTATEQAITTTGTTERGRLLKEDISTTTATTKATSSASEEENGNIPKLTIKIASLTPINATSLMLSIQIHEDHLPLLSDEKILIQYSPDKITWQDVEANIKDLYVEGSDEIHTIINSLLPGKKYYFRAEVNGTKSNEISGSTRTSSSPNSSEGSHEFITSGEDQSIMSGEAVCTYKQKMFAAQEEWFDGCESYCMCEDTGAVNCEPIECPNEYGLELLDPNCVKWEPKTVKDPPNCCPEMKCVQNSSCTYEGKLYDNLVEIPSNITGCNQRCACYFGNVTCEERCVPITPTPPTNLHCPAEFAIRVKLEHDECCEKWICKDSKLNPNGTQHSLNNVSQALNNNNSQPQFPSGHIPIQIHLDGIDEDDDQFIPPSTGNQPTVVSLDHLHQSELQELLHQLSTLGENTSGANVDPFAKGTYLSIKNPQEVQEFEANNGAKVIGQAEDGSFIIFIPAPSENNVPNRRPPKPNAPFPPHLHPGLPGPEHFPFHPHDFGQASIGLTAADEITGVSIRPLNESALHVDFTVSPVLVGLHGAVEVRYTHEFMRKPNPDQWEKQLFQQPEDVIDNAHLQLFLTGLRPDTEYHVQIQVLMTDIHNTPESDIYVIRTPPPAVPTTTLPPEIIIDPEIKLVEVTSTSAQISWRKFTDFEGSLIDAVQVRYKSYTDQFYATTPLIHRSISFYNITNLHPDTKYEVNLLLVPFTNQTTELKSSTPIHLSTTTDADDYTFTISIEAGKVTGTTAELTLAGVPFPEDKFVNIYQVIYQSDNEKEQKSSFKVAKRDSTKVATVTDLKPGTRYRVWIEAFLTNGKKKRSDVIEVETKSGGFESASSDIIENNIDSHRQVQNDGRSESSVQESSNYYGALVALAIITALSIIAIVVLLMILIKKQNQAKIPINDRKSESSYDNPSFKNYDIEANGNGHSHSKPGEL